MIRTFFRIVRTNPPTERDFYSYERLGIPDRRPTPASLRRRQGIPVFATLERAQDKLERHPHLGSRIAIMELDEARFDIVQTGSDPLHFTLWADPVMLLTTIVGLAPLEAEDHR